VSTPTKLREIERLRACAVLMVMSFHSDQWHRMLPEIAQKSWTGVDLFFVISGYVVTLSLVRLLPSLEGATSFAAAFGRARAMMRTFYVRRFFRILPAAFAVALFDRELIVHFPDFLKGGATQWFTEAVCIFGGIYNYAFAFHGEFNMGVYWSLAVEEHFYLLLPILFVVFRTANRRLLACIGLGGLSIALRMAPSLDDVTMPKDWDKFSSHLRFDTLMAGVALALLADRARAAKAAPWAPILPPWLLRYAILPAILVVIACLPSVAPDAVFHRVGFIALWMLSGVLVSYAAMDRGYVLELPGLGRLLEYVGSRSYALYLVHVPAEWLEYLCRTHRPRFAELVAGEPDFAWRQALAQLAIALLLAEVLHRVVEKPLMAVGRRLIDGWRRRETEGHPGIA